MGGRTIFIYKKRIYKIWQILIPDRKGVFTPVLLLPQKFDIIDAKRE